MLTSSLPCLDGLEVIPAVVTVADESENQSDNDSREVEASSFATNCVVDAGGRMWREIPPHKGQFIEFTLRE